MVEIQKSKREETLLKKCKEGVLSAHNTHPSGGYDQTTSLEEKVNSLTVTYCSYSNLLLCNNMMCGIVRLPVSLGNSSQRLATLGFPWYSSQ